MQTQILHHALLQPFHHISLLFHFIFIRTIESNSAITIFTFSLNIFSFYHLSLMVNHVTTFFFSFLPFSIFIPEISLVICTILFIFSLILFHSFQFLMISHQHFHLFLTFLFTLLCFFFSHIPLFMFTHLHIVSAHCFCVHFVFVFSFFQISLFMQEIHPLFFMYDIHRLIQLYEFLLLTQ